MNRSAEGNRRLPGLLEFGLRGDDFQLVAFRNDSAVENQRMPLRRGAIVRIHTARFC